MRRHADQRPDRHDTGAADAGDQQRIRFVERRQHRLGQRLVARRHPMRAPQRRTLDGDQRRAAAFEAAQVEVAGERVDPSFLPELGVHRHHRQAVRLEAAVAAAFAHRLVDEDLARQRRQRAAPALPPCRRGAGLVVDEHADAAHAAQLELHRVEPLARQHRGARGESRVHRVLGDVVGEHDDARDAFGVELARELRHAERAVERLATGHRHRVVVEQLVGDVDARGDGRADRQQPGVEIGAVAHVGEHMRRTGMLGHADPGRAFAAHLADRQRAPLHRHRHQVAADASERTRALGHARRAVVRAARAEVRRALQRRTRQWCAAVDRRVRQRAATVGQRFGAGAPGPCGVDARQPRRQRARDDRRRQLAGGRQQPLAVWRRPLADLVELADDARTHVVAPVVEHLLQLVFDDRALLLDDQDLVESGGEAAHPGGLERPRHADLVDAQAQRRGSSFVDPQVVQRLAQVQPGLAARDQAQARLRAVEEQPVQAIGTRIRRGGVDLVRLHPVFLRQLRVGPADVHAVGGQLEVLGHAHPHPRRVDLDRGRTLDDVGAELQRNPATGVARHGPAVQPEVDDLLHTGGREHRQRAGREDVLALVRHCRRARRVVVAGHHQHAAMGQCAGVVGVLEDVAATIDARPLAVPHREDAIAFGLGQQVQLLRAPDRGGRQLLVDGGVEAHVMGGEKGFSLVQRGIQPAEWRAAVARDVARGVQARGAIALALHHRQARQRLHAGQEDAAPLEPVAVGKGSVSQRHRRFSFVSWTRSSHPVAAKSGARRSRKAPMPSRAAAVQATCPNAR